jgi:WD40 repeat protein
MNGSIPLQKIKVLSNHSADGSSSAVAPIIGLAYSPQKNILLSCGGRDDRKITFWDLNSGRAFRFIQATYGGELKSLSLRSDGQSVVVSDDSGEIKLFNFEDGKLLKLSNNGHAASVSAIQVAPNSSKLISGDVHGGLFMWNLD